MQPFEPFKTSVVPYDITNYQQLYFYTESFEEANEKLRAFAESMPRPFVLVYNPNTQVCTFRGENFLVRKARCYITESFEEANQKLRAVAGSIPCPFVLVFNIKHSAPDSCTQE